jgi:hypothetical protein
MTLLVTVAVYLTICVLCAALANLALLFERPADYAAPKDATP